MTKVYHLSISFFVLISVLIESFPNYVKQEMMPNEEQQSFFLTAQRIIFSTLFKAQDSSVL